MSNEVSKQLYLVRHGDVGCQGRYIGSSDPSLTTLGRRQVMGLAAALHATPFDAIFSSPLRRCRQSLELLGKTDSAVLREELREVDFGAWEGKSYAEIVAADPGAMSAWASGAADFGFPGGERLAAFHQRVTRFWGMLAEQQGQALLVVTHGGVIRHLLCLALALPWERYLSFDIQLASCTTLSLYSGGAVLTGLNLKGGA